MALTKVDISLMQNTGTTANKLLAYDGSGNLPAVDGSQLTNVATGITESSSDPAIDTNPSGGVGTEWVNTTSGEVYICTDATTDENVWTNVGAGSGDITPYFGYQGELYGYNGGGSSRLTTIDRFSFTTDGNSVDWADCASGRDYNTSSSSATHGYIAAGGTNFAIEKFPFASQTNATNIGTMSINSTRENSAGMGSETYGYICGGKYPGPNYYNIIEKYPFASDANGTDHADTLQAINEVCGNASVTHGYICGGYRGVAYENTIQKFSFASNANATDVGDLTGVIGRAAGSNSTTHGYKAGGSSSSGAYPTTNSIQKWAFASDANATNVGNSIVGRFANAGHSSTNHGYQSMGSGGADGNSIEKYPFATDSNATDVGDLTVSGSYGAGQHY